MSRVSKENYYLDIAQTVSARGTCLRRKFGAIIVKNDSIVSTGYAGAPRGRLNCCDRGVCLRDQLNIPRGERYELCRSGSCRGERDYRRPAGNDARRRPLSCLHRPD